MIDDDIYKGAFLLLLNKGSDGVIPPAPSLFIDDGGNFFTDESGDFFKEG